MGTRSGNPLWKNNKSGGTPISAEALNRIEDALDSEDTYISELIEDSDSAINTSQMVGLVRASNSDWVCCKGVSEKYNADTRILISVATPKFVNERLTSSKS